MTKNHPSLAKRRCKNCRRFVSDSPFTGGIYVFCDLDCAVAWSKSDAALKVAKKRLAAENRAARQRLKTWSSYNKEAQAAFNRYIRIRDKYKPCISTGRPADDRSNIWDAGHYRSRGAASHLRFNLHNCHKQSKQANRFLSGDVVEYRINLINRIGIAKVETLEADNQPRKFTVDYLERVKKIFTAKSRLYARLFR